MKGQWIGGGEVMKNVKVAIAIRIPQGGSRQW